MPSRAKNFNDSVGASIKQLRLSKNITQKEMAEHFHKSESAVRMWELGKSEPDLEMLKQIAAYFNVSIDYLLRANGEPTAEQRGSKREHPASVKIPVYGTIAAGIPLDAVEDILDYEEIPAEMARDGEYFALQIKGDSMEPRVYSGDVVIFRRQPDCVSGQTCAVLINGDEATMKRVIKRPNGITLLPLNAKYEPMNFTNEEVLSIPVAILGVAVEVRGKFM